MRPEKPRSYLDFAEQNEAVALQCNGAAACLPKIYVGGPAISSAVLRDVLQTSSQAKICSDVNRKTEMCIFLHTHEGFCAEVYWAFFILPIPASNLSRDSVTYPTECIYDLLTRLPAYSKAYK